MNTCISSHDAPRDWLTTVLVGLLKMGRAADDPESYRLVGLECCLLKMLTLLIDSRIRDWAGTNSILPDSQNGFRERYRTNNNAFVLRCAIDNTRARGRSLFVGFIDLTNAFPSTDLPTLWTKLYRSGVSGPLFDWLRMLYVRMSYVVRHGDVLSDSFKSLIGVLTGDTASPVLWNVYFADLPSYFPDDAHDILLAGRAISHTEQADDVALFSTTLEGLQRKIECFYKWCRSNFMVISARKSKFMIFGPRPAPVPPLMVGDEVVELVDQYKYVGVTFSSSTRNVFALHYHIKASKARNLANACFAIEAMVGSLPPAEGRQLYMARVDPYLISACDIALDIDAPLRTELEACQLLYLRRLLGLHRRCVRSVLFTETGLVPIRYRRVILALGYLRYLVSLPANHYARAALEDALALDYAGLPSWFADLRYVLLNLPIPVSIQAMQTMDVDHVDGFLEAVESSFKRDLYDELECSPKTLLLHGRDTSPDNITSFRGYLRIHVPAYRKALIRLVSSSHGLAIERLRFHERYRPRIPRAWRLCQFCFSAPEDEVHALLACTGNDDLMHLRRRFLVDVIPLDRTLLPNNGSITALAFLRQLCWSSKGCDVFAKYVYNVFQIFQLREMFVPAPYLYRPL